MLAQQSMQVPHAAHPACNRMRFDASCFAAPVQMSFLASTEQCDAMKGAGVGSCCGSDMCNAPQLSCYLGVAGGSMTTTTLAAAAALQQNTSG